MADCYANGKVPVFPCGGGSNTGEIADPVARQMQKNNLGKMNCLASQARILTDSLFRHAVPT